MRVSSPEAAGGGLLGHGGEQRRVDAHRAVGRGGGGVGEGAGHRGARAEHVGLHVLLDRGDAHAVAEVAERLGRVRVRVRVRVKVRVRVRVEGEGWG